MTFKLPKPPKLEVLTTEPVTLEQLQAALVELINIVNKNAINTNEALSKKEPKEWRATL